MYMSRLPVASLSTKMAELRVVLRGLMVRTTQEPV